ncbi:MAG: TerD family protein [Ruminococcus sp.]|nr:TerD family protein [Ruminococcus sp.]
MSISLQKGQKVSLTKDNAGLAKVVIGLGWDQVQQKRGLFAPKPAQIDCDASAIMLQNGKLANKADIIYYGNLNHRSNSVRHLGDNLTGAGDGDDEQIKVDLAAVPAEYDRIIVVVNIFQAVQRKQDFGMIKNAFIRIIDDRTGVEMCRYNLTDNYSGMTSMIFGELYRHNNEWKFNAMGQGTTDPGLPELAGRFQ